MSLMQTPHAVLVLVDYQARLLPTLSDAAKALNEALYLAQAARLLSVPVLGTEQNPKGLGSNVPALKELCSLTLEKSHFGACADGLMQALCQLQPEVRQVVIAGCEAHVCLLQTALGLLQEGLEVHVVVQACASRQPADKMLAMQRLQQSGAVLVSPDMVVFEWMRACTHPRFKEVLALIKQRAGAPS